ncbi:MAG TPA: hypothetical protein DCL93_00785 [Faecalibacterium sp.]|jgi:hypothetical protein|nr:hypothetical protein [Faecalibacterium sp.]
MKKITRRNFLRTMSLATVAIGMLTACSEQTFPPFGDGSTALSSLKPLNGRCDWNAIAPEDPFGNSYANAVNYAVFEVYGNTWDGGIWDSGGSYRGSFEYRVYKKYGKLTMNLTPYKSIGEEGTALVQVYADDKLVQTAPLIRQKTDTVKLEANIEGAEYIKIFIKLSKGAYDITYGALIISDAKLWPKENNNL